VFERFAGRGEEAIVGFTDEQLFSPEAARQYRSHDLALLQNRQAIIYEEEMVFADGRRGLFETIKTHSRPRGRLSGVLGVARDITDRKRAEREIERLAFFDALTDLPNRRLLMDRLHQACLVSARMGTTEPAVPRSGQFQGPQRHARPRQGRPAAGAGGRRLSQCVRQCDTVARLGATSSC
jgi:PAS domain S-box-containing protein